MLAEVAFEPVDGGERRRSGVTKRANSATAELLVIIAKNTYWCPGKDWAAIRANLNETRGFRVLVGVWMYL
jgi:hypothetical protein